MIRPHLVVALANARAARRPPGARAAEPHDALADASRASELLEPFLGRRVEESDLAAVRAVHRATVAVVDALIDGSDPPLDALNALAAREPAVSALERRAGRGLAAVLRPGRPSAVAALLVAVIRDLGELEPSRLRRCARPECGLVFYDATRTGARRASAPWPSGWRRRRPARTRGGRIGAGATAPARRARG